ncbi:MAG: SDR family oxidoreductase [Algoriphagus sp.]|nr:SDR family oxidoreductase [Algoriphagus sp.]
MKSTLKKIALITGASRGLGKDMAIKLAQRGNDIIITYNTKEADAQEVVAAIQKSGHKAAALQLNTADVTSFHDFSTTLQKTLKEKFESERFDFLVNNAGFGTSIPSFEATTVNQFDELLNVHFKGVFFLTQKLLPLVNNGGSIVNLSTGLTRFTFAGSGAYACMKSAIETLTLYLAKELGSRYIRANVVAPGAIATDFNDGIFRQNVQIREYIQSITALGRTGHADDIGGVVAFLCSEDSKWVTAQRIEASGGMYL